MSYNHLINYFNFIITYQKIQKVIVICYNLGDGGETMFEYPKSLEYSKQELFSYLETLKEQGYEVQVETFIIDEDYSIDKITINQVSRVMNRVVLSSGIHGIEGYIGHVFQMYFLEHILPDLNKHTQVILYHVINPFGMKNYRRTNKNNIDLNRNYSKNAFSSKNPEFLKVHRFLSPRRFHSVVLMNMWFYFSTVYYLLIHNRKTMNIAILKGQKIDETSLYYTGTDYQKSTNYIIDELDKLYSYVDDVVWLDIHSGYGGKYQLSVINSRYELETTKELKDKLTYQDIIGDEDTFYDTDGDITEKLYEAHNQKNYQSDLLALCLEFGTVGNGILSNLRSLKAMMFENGVYHVNANNRVTRYTKKLMKRLFMPNTDKWKRNALMKYDQIVREIMQYKKLM